MSDDEVALPKDKKLILPNKKAKKGKKGKKVGASTVGVTQKNNFFK